MLEIQGFFQKNFKYYIKNDSFAIIFDIVFNKTNRSESKKILEWR